MIVHAKKGERASYQPIQSQLTNSSQPLDIVSALLDVYPFEQLYIADLDAIQKRDKSHKRNYSVIAAIKRSYPKLQLWIDAGISEPEDLDIWNMPNIYLVLGSENFEKINSYLIIRELLENKFILSLDFFSDGYHGPLELMKDTTHWPQDVVVMSLANVGMNQGINKVLLTEITEQAPHKKIYAAGGVRNQEDLQILKSIGITGTLVATSLHQEQITKQHLEAL